MKTCKIAELVEGHRIGPPSSYPAQISPSPIGFSYRSARSAWTWNLQRLSAYIYACTGMSTIQP